MSTSTLTVLVWAVVVVGLVAFLVGRHLIQYYFHRRQKFLRDVSRDPFEEKKGK